MKNIYLLVFSLFSIISSAQTEPDKLAFISGKILYDGHSGPIEGIDVIIPKLKLLNVTAADGTFSFNHVKYGSYTLIISFDAELNDSIQIFIDGPVVDLGVIKIKNGLDQVGNILVRTPVIEVNGHNGNDDSDGPDDQSISGILNAGRDPYVAAASFAFNAFRYQMRGYNRNQLEVYLNGLQMNNIEGGSASFSQWGGLNDMFRDQSTTFALQANENGFGGLIGVTSITASAADQHKQTKFSYTVTNRVYRNRVMASYSTGLMSNGWALAAAISRRWGEQGYVEGTAYEGYSYYAGISKKLAPTSLLSFTAFGASVQSGKAAPATIEAMDLAGSHFYNPNWGNQNGVARNARASNAYQPAFLLNYNYKPNNNTRFDLVGAYQTGYSGNTALDYYNAQDPRPDYYRNLPSYYETDESTADPEKAAAVREQWLSDPAIRQINWDRMYGVNKMNFETFNGVSGNRSAYVLGENRNDIKKYSFAANLQKVINDCLSVSGGLLFVAQQTERYRKMIDLLGGDYFVNLNQFAERTYVGNSSFAQNDLNNPNAIVKVEDKYAYNYQADFRKAFIWGQVVFTQRKLDLFLAGRVGEHAFGRNGYYKNGLFPDDSYGKSVRQNFIDYQLKGGLTYKINGRNYLYINAAVITDAPTFDNTFVSPDIRNVTVKRPELEKAKSIEGGYILHTPRLTGRASVFTTDLDDATKIIRFYHDDYRTFVNYVMRNVNIRHIGAEIALQAKISPSFSANAVIAWAQVFYTSNPKISIYRDNDTSKNIPQTISYLKNMHVAAGPQSAYTFGLNYRSPKFWYVNANFNFLNRNYMGINPGRRTAEAIGLVPTGSFQWHSIVDQKMLSSAFTVDIFGGRSFLLNKFIKWLPRGTFAYLNAGVNNLLNNKNIQTGGFEQLRFDKDSKNPERFPPKYFYGYGANYFVSISFKL